MFFFWMTVHVGGGLVNGMGGFFTSVLLPLCIHIISIVNHGEREPSYRAKWKLSFCISPPLSMWFSVSKTRLYQWPAFSSTLHGNTGSGIRLGPQTSSLCDTPIELT